MVVDFLDGWLEFVFWVSMVRYLEIFYGVVFELGVCEVGGDDDI